VNPGQGKLLVIRGGAIGDFVLTLPAIASLRRQFPAAHLEILGSLFCCKPISFTFLLDIVEFLQVSLLG